MEMYDGGGVPGLLQARYGSSASKMGSMDSHLRCVSHGWPSWAEAG